MKILNISSILPLEGLKRENDIVLRIQDYLKKEYNHEFVVAKALPFTPKILGILSSKWEKYHKYIKTSIIDLQGYQTLIYPWIMPPTSNLWLNYILIPFNIVLFQLQLKKRFLNLASNTELILAQNNIPDSIIAYLLAKKIKKPYILNARGDFNPIILKLPLLSKIYKNASQIITHSPQNFKKLKNKINIELIPHPIEPLFFNENRLHERQPITFISVCRLLKLKHLDWVLDSLYSEKKKGRHFSYHIVGDGPELNFLKQKVVDLNLQNEVIFHGYLNHIKTKDLLIKSHVFIMPSHPETLGRAFLEAAASNCLIVGYRNTGVDGLFEHNKSAIFIDKNSINNEIQILFDKFSENYMQFFTKNSRQIVNNFTWEKIGKKYHHHFQHNKGKRK